MAAGGVLAREGGGGGGGGEAPCGRRESESREGSGRGRRRKGRMTAPPLLMLLCGAATVVAWASLASLAAAASAPPEEEEEEHATESPVRELSGSNWSLLLQGQWMVAFYAPWCPACQQMESAWEAFARSSQDLELHVGKVDVTQEPGVSGRFFVTTLPTIYHAKDGVFRRYRGSRSLEDLQNYILEKKWESVEPVAGWKSPSSILMHGMAGLFHLSGWIRQIDNYLTGTLELPVWGSYAVFIVATLLIGLILGLILVLLADCIYPPKPRAESPDVMDPSDDKTEELQVTQETTSKETHMENGLSEGEDEDESEENSSEDSAVEGSQSEEDVGQDESGQVEESSVRQRKNQVEATEL